MRRFGKIKLLGAMALLAAAMALTVRFFSPYAPLVEPCPENIEDIWAIEDARTESDAPLVTHLDMNGQTLGYDEETNTFYCPVGLGEGDWPQIRLTAPGAKGVRLCFVDDYSYDWRSDAVRDGYEYQIIAYDDASFSYSYVVFTGLPIVVLDTDEALRPHEDVPAEISISVPGETGLKAHARAHERGDTSLRMRPKHGVKVEFTRGADGTRKVSRNMPVLGETDEFILIACSMDGLLIRDKLSWDLWNGIATADEAFGTRETAYCEVFAGGEYLGVYVMMKPYDYAKELLKLGANAPATDGLYRLAGRSVHEFDRPLVQDHRNIYYEQHYVPAGETGHGALEPYLDLFAEEDDAAFKEKAEKLLDIESVIRYVLFTQACGMMDNEQNNLYILCHREGNGMRYLFAPWDLDISWGMNDEENAEVWYEFPIFDRLLTLDVGNVRQRMQEIWQDMRRAAFTGENVERLLNDYNTQLNDSGAFYRDAVKWNRPNSYSENYNIYSYACQRFEMMDRRVDEIADESLRGHRIRVQGYTTFDDGLL